MNRKEHIIEFNKLKTGHNELAFKIDAPFLAEQGVGEGYQADIQADFTIQKSENMYKVSCKLGGKATVTCDICLDEFEMPVDSEWGFIIKISEEEKYDDDEIYYISPAAIDFDLSQFLYDSFMLSLPVKKTCSLAGKKCNEAVMQKLKKLNETPTDDDAASSDPRWDKLKGIINPN